MIHQRTETKGAAGEHHPELPPRSRREHPAEAPQPEIDLERVVWDPEYRDEVHRRLRTAAPERSAGAVGLECRRIVAAINEMQRAEPAAGERRH